LKSLRLANNIIETSCLSPPAFCTTFWNHTPHANVNAVTEDRLASRSKSNGPDLFLGGVERWGAKALRITNMRSSIEHGTRLAEGAQRFF
jgi:hypothetical protein